MKWHGIMIIENISVIRNNVIIQEEENILNVLHSTGEEWVLKALFAGEAIPTYYYIGLDNRSTVAAADSMADISGEPNSDGYFRQSVGSSAFTVALYNGIYKATSGIVTFNATGSGWGPVKNIFLTNASTSGTLISSAALSVPLSLSAGDAVNMRMSMTLRNCPQTFF